jgi:hypothetical protein
MAGSNSVASSMTGASVIWALAPRQVFLYDP